MMVIEKLSCVHMNDSINENLMTVRMAKLWAAIILHIYAIDTKRRRKKINMINMNKFVLDK